MKINDKKLFYRRIIILSLDGSIILNGMGHAKMTLTVSTPFRTFHRVFYYTCNILINVLHCNCLPKSDSLSIRYFSHYVPANHVNASARGISIDPSLGPSICQHKNLLSVIRLMLFTKLHSLHQKTVRKQLNLCSMKKKNKLKKYTDTNKIFLINFFAKNNKIKIIEQLLCELT